MIRLALLLSTLSVNASPSMAAMDPAQRDSQCLVALRAERELGPKRDEAARYFDARISTIGDEELRKLLMISAEKVMLRHANRRPFAANCVLLFQVLALQEVNHEGRESE